MKKQDRELWQCQREHPNRSRFRALWNALPSHERLELLMDLVTEGELEELAMEYELKRSDMKEGFNGN